MFLKIRAFPYFKILKQIFCPVSLPVICAQHRGSIGFPETARTAHQKQPVLSVQVCVYAGNERRFINIFFLPYRLEFIFSGIQIDSHLYTSTVKVFLYPPGYYNKYKRI